MTSDTTEVVVVEEVVARLTSVLILVDVDVVITVSVAKTVTTTGASVVAVAVTPRQEHADE